MEAKAEEREFIVEKGKTKNNISKRTVYSGTLFIYITKKKATNPDNLYKYTSFQK